MLLLEEVEAETRGLNGWKFERYQAIFGLKERIAECRYWGRVDATVECFEQWLRVPAWSRRMRVVVYRKRVHHRSAKNYQLDLFDPDDGSFEYSAIVTNKEVTGRTLWFFMCGRGTHEKV